MVSYYPCLLCFEEGTQVLILIVMDNGLLHLSVEVAESDLS